MVKKLLLLVFALSMPLPRLWAQHYLTLGMGFSTTIYNSNELDNFSDTYNLMNQPYLLAPLQGFGSAEGFRWEGGYRRFGRLNITLLAGLQTFLSKDAAPYKNGELRELQLKMSSLYIEYEMGRAWKRLFVNGTMMLFLNRRFTIASTYFAATGEVSRTPLDGTYKTKSAFSGDLGIAVGFFREPVFLVAKVTYPVFTGGASHVFEDRRSRKIAERTNIFPSDYIKYSFRERDDGVAANIDGLKISATVAFAFRIK